MIKNTENEKAANTYQPEYKGNTYKRKYPMVYYPELTCIM